MFVVGLTGGIGSGKSTVAEHFSSLGIDLVDADILSREVVEPGTLALDQIAHHFGSDILTADGGLDRAKLRKIIFDEPAEQTWLENLLHPLIAQLLKERIAQCQSAYCLLVSPLLLETDQHKMVDRVLVVDVSESTQLERTLQRDSSSEAATIKSIIAAQIKRPERLQKAHDILDNGKEEAEIRPQVEALHNQYLAMARQKSR